MVLRKHLLAGTVPQPGELSWPGPGYREQFVNDIRRFHIEQFCKGDEGRTDELIRSILENMEVTERERPRETAAASSRQNDQADGSASGSESALKNDEKEGEDGHLEQKPDLQEVESNLQKGSRERFQEQWGEVAQAWNEVSRELGDLGECLGEDWSFAERMLAQGKGWGELKRLRRLSKASDQIREILRQIGRLRQTPETEEKPSLSRQIVEPLSRVREEIEEKVSPHAVCETRGITRGDDVTRMLPTESVLLGHPTLKLLWHARRAEQSLQTYQVVGVEPQVRQVVEIGDSTRSVPEKAPRQERGPIMICLDTSGSMAGPREEVAKALTLEACQIAKRERRWCFVYAFSGTGQIKEIELSFSAGGMETLMEFLEWSFEGGTDIAGPLEKAVQRLGETDWKRADILLISDGEFEVPPGTLELIQQAREQERLRVHGLWVPGWMSAPGSMRSLCEPLHVFRDWHLVE